MAAHPRDPGTAWFVPAIKDECRIPLNARLVVTRTTDGGRTFEALHEELPSVPCYDLIYRHCLAVSDDGGFLAVAIERAICRQIGALPIPHSGLTIYEFSTSYALMDGIGGLP